MTDSLVSPPPRDGVWLANTVRGGAVTVRRLQIDPEAATPEALADVTRELRALSDHLDREPTRSAQLRLWVENLARQLASIA